MTGWSLRRQLQRVLAALGIVVVALVSVALILLVQMRSQQEQVVDRYFAAVNTSNQLFIAQLDAETAVRGYALTGNRQTLAPIRALVSANYQRRDAKLRASLRSDPTLVGLLDDWFAATSTWYRQWAIPMQHKIRAGHALDAADVITGMTLFDANRSAYQQYSDRLGVKRDAESSALRVRTTVLFVAVFVAFGGAVLAGAGLWLALRSWVLRPVAELGRETRLVRSGELQHEVSVQGPAEISALAADVEDMRRDLVAQTEDLARSNRDLEQFAYVASHDLQEPLRKVTSFCQMLERRYAGQLDERADQYIAFAVDGAKRMQQLINDLLSFSRVGRLSEGRSDVELADCLDAALANLAGAVEASGARVVAAPLPRVSGERPLLVQLFQNLIGNAIKFRGDRQPEIRIGAQRRDDESWELSCSDNGIGIEPQYAERIFVIFQRLHGKDEFSGTGIGLALCKRIVEHHGGEIWLDTSAAAGTTFRWTLPAATDDVGDTGGHD